MFYMAKPVLMKTYKLKGDKPLSLEERVLLAEAEFGITLHARNTTSLLRSPIWFRTINFGIWRQACLVSTTVGSKYRFRNYQFLLCFIHFISTANPTNKINWNNNILPGIKIVHYAKLT